MTALCDHPGEQVSALADLPDMIRPEELMPVLRCGRSSVYDAITRGDVPSVRIGRRLYVPKQTLLRMWGLQDRVEAGWNGPCSCTSNALQGVGDPVTPPVEALS